MAEAAEVNVVIVTYKRTTLLRRCLHSLAQASQASSADISVTVTVIDDDPAGSAQPVAKGFDERFEGGCNYELVGSRNISRARNAGLVAARQHSTWTASVDDDVAVPRDWFDVCIDAARRTGATAVTGSIAKDFTPGPRWLQEQPFDQIGITRSDDLGQIGTCATGNNWIASAFLRGRPELLFDEGLGRTGGEDVDFFERAIAAGLQPVFVEAAAVLEEQLPERLTLSYQLRRAFWLGVTEATFGRMRKNTSRSRLCARAAKRAVTGNRGKLTSQQRAAIGLRYRFTVALQSLGLVIGSFGYTLNHK